MDLPQWYFDLRFQLLAEEESKRTVVCAPEWEHAIRAAIDQLGVRHDLHTVVGSVACPSDTFFIIDEQAMEAALRESHERWKPAFRASFDDPGAGHAAFARRYGISSSPMRFPLSGC